MVKSKQNVFSGLPVYFRELPISLWVDADTVSLQEIDSEQDPVLPVWIDNYKILLHVLYCGMVQRNSPWCIQDEAKIKQVILCVCVCGFVKPGLYVDKIVQNHLCITHLWTKLLFPHFEDLIRLREKNLKGKIPEKFLILFRLP